MTAVAGQPHFHAELWEMRPGLSDAARALALDVLPLLRLAKSALIELGGRALVGSSPEDLTRTRLVAGTLEARCHRDLEQIESRTPSEVLAPLLLGPLSALEVSAQASADDNGRPSPESAAGLREAYAGLPRAADLFWRLELVPEGRAPTTDPAGKQQS